MSKRSWPREKKKTEISYPHIDKCLHCIHISGENGYMQWCIFLRTVSLIDERPQVRTISHAFRHRRYIILDISSIIFRKSMKDLIFRHSACFSIPVVLLRNRKDELVRNSEGRCESPGFGCIWICSTAAIQFHPCVASIAAIAN